MQEVSSVRFVSNNLRSSALKAWHLLLEQNDLYAPAIDGSMTNSTLRFDDPRKAARLMVDLHSSRNDFTFAWTDRDDYSRAATPGRRSSYSELADDECFLEELEAADEHAEYMQTVGADLLLDSFHLAVITDNRPLFTATMMSLKQHNLIEDLGLDRGTVAQFLMKVEEG